MKLPRYTASGGGGGAARTPAVLAYAVGHGAWTVGDTVTISDGTSSNTWTVTSMGGTSPGLTDLDIGGGASDGQILGNLTSNVIFASNGGTLDCYAGQPAGNYLFWGQSKVHFAEFMFLEMRDQTASNAGISVTWATTNTVLSFTAGT